MSFEIREYEEDNEKDKVDGQSQKRSVFEFTDIRIEPKETENRLWIPRINGTPIQSLEHLHNILDSEYPGLKRNPAYAKALQDAEHHLILYILLKDTTSLPRGTLIQIARAHRYPPTQVYEYVSRGKRPYLYRLSENAVSKTEAQRRLTELHEKNTRLHSYTGIRQRLHTYYPHSLLETSPHYPKWLRQTEKYFAVLDLLKDGGTFADVARLLELDERHVKRWFTDEHTPKLVQLARHIPPVPPQTGNKWLPTKLEAGHGFEPTKFIQVPKQIIHWHQICDVVNQLQKLDTPQMHHWHKQFGPITQEHAFAYLLGMLLSDASKPKNSFSSAGFCLGLSRSYPWSKRVGDAACYYLSHLGIEAKRGTDQENNRIWFSGHTPLMPWIMQSCFNITGNETTTYSQIKAVFIFNAPKNARIAFLNGITDGDGIISTKWQQLGISNISNQAFLQEFLRTFNIESSIDNDRIRIHRDNLEHAIKLPFFRHATGRQEKAEKLVDMLHLRIPRRETVSKEILQKMINLRNQGKSYGEISEVIYDKYEYSISHSKVYHILKKMKPKKTLRKK